MIVSDPEIMLGKPTIQGTRLTVEWILERLSAGETIDNLILEHPQLKRDNVLEALDYAAKVLRSEVVYPLRVA